MRGLSGRHGGGGGGRGGTRLAGMLALLVPLVCCDVVFRVPEVLVRHAAASKPVGTGPGNCSRTNSSGEGGATGSPGVVQYEEYFVEHDIPTADARAAARALDLDTVPASLPGCGTCSRRDMEYCEERVVADHCCCERRFVPEPLPWAPHTCYAGPARCRVRAGDCARYVRLRDCCCRRLLAERWKAILSNSPRLGAWHLAVGLVGSLVTLAYL